MEELGNLASRFESAAHKREEDDSADRLREVELLVSKETALNSTE